jgi:alanine dehydrogenase
MIIGVPKEVKNNEFRVGIVPSGVKVLISAGHRVIVEKNAGEGRVTTLVSEPWNMEESVIESHVVVGGVLVPGARAPVLIREETVKNMKEGAVIVDCSVDQGGCIETIKPTTHSNPTYIHGEVIHYGVTNMPSAFSKTSTFALTSVTFPYALKIAQMGIDEGLRGDKALARGTNVYKGKIVHPSLAESLGMDYTPLDSSIQC